MIRLDLHRWVCMLLGVAVWRGARADVMPVYYQPVIMAGTATGPPADSPANRVDPNTTSSLYAGIGSVKLLLPGTGTFLATGVPISPHHILAAAHTLDPDNNGTIDFTAGNVEFNLNYGGELTSTITASGLAIHPSFTGFNPVAPTHDDLAIITLSSDLPAGVPIYDIWGAGVPIGTTFTMIGYGLSGYGDVGYSVAPSFSVKRKGANNADAFIADDDGGAFNEIFLFDFDGPGATNEYGGLSLGNDVETTLGGGDSGGPSFMDYNGQLVLAGINTFVARFTGGPQPPLFGSAGGGMLLAGYADWIAQVTGLEVTFVPAPGAVMLGALGLGLVAWLRRRVR